MFSPVVSWSPQTSEPLYRVLTAWGDSLTQGIDSSGQLTKSWPAQLASILSVAGYSGWTVNDRGITSQTSTQIANRQGAYNVTISVSGAQIPASGAVTLTAISDDLLMNTLGVPQYPAMTGTIAGVHGTLTSTSTSSLPDPTGANGMYSFTRTTSGSAMTCPASTQFISDDAIARRGDIQTFLWGRNNPMQSVVSADIAAAITYLSPYFKKFVVMSVINALNETVGTSGYSIIVGINTALQAAWPNNYLNVRSPPTTAEQTWLLVNYGWSPSTQDQTDMTNDTIPTSLRGVVGGVSDNIHMNDTGYALLAYRVFNFLLSKGWLL
jgi:hypothetical protein